MDRRDFLSAALLATGSMTSTGCSPQTESEATPATGGIPAALGVQLYTLRSAMDDPAAILATLSSLGYEEVELAGLYGRSPMELRSMLDDHGLRAPSSHVGLERFEDGAREALFDEAETLGHRWLVCPWMPEALRTPDGYRQIADLFNAAGEDARERGLGVVYHNHAFEFEALDDGSTGLATLLERGVADLLSFQLDLFWTVDAGEDPLQWFGRHRGRWVSVHAKDRTADGTMVAVGDGQLDFAALIRAGTTSGVQHVFVEHDNPGDPIDSVSRSLRHLRGLQDTLG